MRRNTQATDFHIGDIVVRNNPGDHPEFPYATIMGFEEGGLTIKVRNNWNQPLILKNVKLKDIQRPGDCMLNAKEELFCIGDNLVSVDRASFGDKEKYSGQHAEEDVDHCQVEELNQEKNEVLIRQMTGYGWVNRVDINLLSKKTSKISVPK